MKKKIKLRKECNELLQTIIRIYLNQYPNIRLVQALWNLTIIDKRDRFSEEPYDTLVRIKPHIIQLLSSTEGDCSIILSKLKELGIFENGDLLNKRVFYEHEGKCKIGILIGITESSYIINTDGTNICIPLWKSLTLV